MRLPLLLACAIGFVVAPTSRADEKDELAKKAYKVLETHCYRCHGQNGASEGGVNYMLDFAKLIENKKVVSGKPLESRIYKRMNPDLIGDMPQDFLTEPNADDIAVIAKWIEAGAPATKQNQVQPRPFVGIEEELAAANNYLNGINKDDWRFIRFFSIRNLYNQPPAKVKDADLRLYRAALSKLLNSLHWEDRIDVPKLVDKQGTLLAVDLQKLDWADDKGKNLWKEIVKRYPYGITHGRYPNKRSVNNLWQNVIDKTKTELPILRVDWFIANAARPPLYHLLLEIPETVDDLLEKIPAGAGKLDLQKNFLEGKVARAGFNGSGVSENNNRLIERHETNFGAFWISYDFASSAGEGNLFVFALGPKFDNNPHNRFAFVHDGGEIIFNLPNGMQGYMLATGEGKRIDEGPINIVSDGTKVSGTPAVVNGVSCMACHQHGMIRKDDQIRERIFLGGKAKDFSEKIYLPPAKMNALMDQDEKRFLTALDEATGPFLKVKEDEDKKITDFKEAISSIAKWYVSEELTLEDAASELGLEDPNLLKQQIEGNEKLQFGGLLPLARGGTVKREVWEDLGFLYSPFQNAAEALKLGEAIADK